MRLARAPGEINLGAVVRSVEPISTLVECLATGNTCTSDRTVPAGRHRQRRAATVSRTTSVAIRWPTYCRLAGDGPA